MTSHEGAIDGSSVATTALHPPPSIVRPNQPGVDQESTSTLQTAERVDTRAQVSDPRVGTPGRNPPSISAMLMLASLGVFIRLRLPTRVSLSRQLNLKPSTRPHATKF